MAKKIRPWILLAALAAFFLGMFAAFGPGVYNDSDQYLKMHIHREPLYPLFLLILRTLFGEAYLTALGIIQNLFAAISIWMLAEYMTKKFHLYLWEEGVIILLQLLPHLVTKYVSSLHLFMTNSIMSEAICLPLFTLFLLECFRILSEDGKKGPVWRALLYALLLSLTRTQMMLAILMWAVILSVKAIVGKKKWWLKLLIIAGITVLTISGRMLIVKSYNYVFNGHFINNTYGTVNTLTNILYASNREDGVNIKDEEARDFFYKMYDITEEREANYKYAGDSWNDKVEHIEEWHDTIKYEMIEDVFYQTYDKSVTSDYITQNLMADEVAGKIIAGILPECFGRWFLNYLLIAGYGLIRSIAVVHPIINWIVVCFYLSIVALAIWVLRQGYLKNKEINGAFWLAGIALLAVFANVFAVSITIMTLARYMIYGFALFYIAYFLLIIEAFRLGGRRKLWKIPI